MYTNIIVILLYLSADALGDHALHQHVGQRLEVVREATAVGIFATFLLDEHGQQSWIGPAQPGHVGRRFRSEKRTTGQTAAPSSGTSRGRPVAVRRARRQAVGGGHGAVTVRAA